MRGDSNAVSCSWPAPPCGDECYTVAWSYQALTDFRYFAGTRIFSSPGRAFKVRGLYWAFSNQRSIHRMDQSEQSWLCIYWCRSSEAYVSLYSLQVRAIISDFAVFITIFTMVLVDYALGIPSPKLQVPNEFKVSPPESMSVLNWIPLNSIWTLFIFPQERRDEEYLGLNTGSLSYMRIIIS